MTEEIQRQSALIRKLVERFIDHPEALMIDPREHPGCVYWTMKCHADDFSKMVGKQGAHYQALLVLLAEFGRSTGSQYILKRYLEPDPAQRRDMMHKKSVHHYDVEPAQVLLEEVLGNLGIGQFGLTTVQSSYNPITYVFSITTRAYEDYTLLTVPSENRTNPMTLIGALGTIFRAYANRDGVRLNLEVRHE
jgi:predicted RNA-binding protein YlqC (UPF0109 family)